MNWDSFKWRNHQPDIGRFFNIDPLADKVVHNSPYAFSENKVTTHVELEGLEAESIKKIGNGFKGLGEKVTDKETYSEIGKGFKQLADKSGLTTLAKGVAKLWSKLGIGNAGGGFTLTSEKGGVTGGTDKGVREGKATRLLEVGHLIRPNTRNDAVNLVQGVEEETHIIQNATTTTVDNVTDGTGKEISLDVTVVKDTVLDAKNFNQYEVTLPSGKDTVIQRTNNPEVKRDEQK